MKTRKPKQPTKDDLIRENGMQKEKIERLLSLDEKMRTEFSIILGAPTKMQYANEDRETYAWSQIFAEIGKLLQGRENAYLQSDVYRMKEQIGRIGNKLDAALGGEEKRDGREGDDVMPIRGW